VKEKERGIDLKTTPVPGAAALVKSPASKVVGRKIEPQCTGKKKNQNGGVDQLGMRAVHKHKSVKVWSGKRKKRLLKIRKHVNYKKRDRPTVRREQQYRSGKSFKWTPKHVCFAKWRQF